MTTNEANKELSNITYQAKMGIITYDEGKKLSEPYLEVINEHIARIAKKHGRKPYKMRWAGLTR